jgi:hypothetical protein
MGVDNFGMELQSPDLAVLISGRGNDIARLGKDSESMWEPVNAITVAHPALKLFGKTGKERIWLQYVDHRLAELTAVSSRHNPSTKIMSYELKSIANA